MICKNEYACAKTVKKIDIAKIKAAGYPATTAVLLTNSDDYAACRVNASGRVSAGDSLITVEQQQ